MILDDLKPLEQYRAARAAGTYAFAPQPAYEYLQLPTVETGDDGSQPANVFVADDPKPALLSFYQPAVAASPPTIDIVDGAGRVVRHLRGTHLVDGEQKPYVTNDAGINRVGWDLTEDPPVVWKTAPHWNSPESGPQVLPGTYVVRYRLGAAAIERPLVVRPDPRAAWTPAQLAERHAFLTGLGDDVSRLDVALNALDALRAATHDDDALRAQAAAVSYGLSRDPRAEEDGLLHGDGPREQVLFLASLLSTSQQPPTQRHRLQAAVVTSHVDAALARYRAFAATLPAGMLRVGEVPSRRRSLVSARTRTLRAADWRRLRLPLDCGVARSAVRRQESGSAVRRALAGGVLHPRHRCCPTSDPLRRRSARVPDR